MKKITTLATLLLAFALVGCNNQGSEASGSTEVPASTQTASTEASSTSAEQVSSSSEETVQEFTVTFEPDSHVKVYLFESDDYSQTPVLGNSMVVGYEGAANFKLELDDGYELASKPSIAPSTGYNKLKTPTDTGVAGCYKITKVVSDITVTITTQEEPEVAVGYTVEFVCNEHASVKVYSSQDYTVEPEDATSTQSVDVDTGKPTQNSEIAQVNFLIVLDDGYAVAAENISIEGTYKNLKYQDNNIWRITKISSDLVVTISPVAI